MLKKRTNLAQYSDYLGLGIQIASTMVIPILLGLWLDRKFDTEPYLLLAGSFLGVLSIFGIIYKVSVIANRESDRNRKAKNKDQLK